MTTSAAPLPETSPETLLELCLFFTSGPPLRFTQNDPDIVSALLRSLPMPSRLFVQPHLTLTGDRSMSVIPTAAVTRLDLRTAVLPVWPFLGGADSVQDISEADYLERFDPETYAAARQLAAEQPGRSQHGFTEIEMADGQHLFWEVQMSSRPLLGIDIARLGSSLLTADGLHARLPQNLPTQIPGVMIINPAHIRRLTFSPGPPQPPPHAWQLHQV